MTTKKLDYTDRMLSMIRSGMAMNWRQQTCLALALGFPAILSQISTILMEYIDASMVGHLGADAAASIGLIAAGIWMITGVCSAVSTGFSVQVAHLIGAGNNQGARAVLRQALVVSMAVSSALSLVCIAISPYLPIWLGGSKEIIGDASAYFMIFSAAIPIIQLNYLSSAVLRCAGNMKTPTICNMVMCVLDIVFNFFLIFPTRDITLFGETMTVPGADLGVAGASWGTFLATVVACGIQMWFLLFRSRDLNIVGEKGSYRPTGRCMQRAFAIGSPFGLERIVLCSAQIVTTIIVAPIGSVALAAHSFAITVEGLCYMPGYGISEASTTLVGQSLGAGRKDLTRRFAHITVALGMLVMAIMGIFMYIGAPTIFGLMTENSGIVELGSRILRIEAFAEPMFAASIVTYGVFVGLGRTVVPTAINLVSMWALRLTMAFILAPTYGLVGVWMAMAIELSIRGVVFLFYLRKV